MKVGKNDMEQVVRFSKELIKMRFVCQSGGNNPQVKWVCDGYESIVFASIFFGKLKLTNKGVINVFELESEKWLGEIRKNDISIPKKYKADRDLTFDFFYTKPN